MNHTLREMKILLLVVTDINKFVLIVDLVNLYKNIKVRIKFTDLIVKLKTK